MIVGQAGDRAALDAADAEGTRLLGPFDLFLQARDRTTLVPDAARAKALWPVLGRPGAVLVDGDLIRQHTAGVRAAIRRAVTAMPLHGDFLARWERAGGT